MSNKITVYGRDGYLDHFGHVLRLMRKERGSDTTSSGSIVPRTTNADVRQLAQWYNAEFQRLRSRRGHQDPIHDVWQSAYPRVMSDTKGADPTALYRDNHWFWFQVLAKLANHMEGERTTPTKMELIMESIEEAVDDRIGDARKLVEGAADAAGAVLSSVGDAAEAVADTGKSVWTAVKVVAVVGAVGIGAAIVVPPIVRAVRDRGRDRDHDQQQTEDFHP